MLLKTLVYLILIIAILIRPEATFEYAYNGLYQWAAKMAPTLFPFMMISSIMIYSGADLELGRMLSIPLKRAYKYGTYGIYAIFMGFFCGFPMGAKVVSELCEQKKLSNDEAVSLLGFCNNIGPSYFLGIIIPMLHACGYKNTFPFIFGMYGIPAVYGIFLSHRFYDKSLKTNQNLTAGCHRYQKKSVQAPSLIGCLKKACAENTSSLIILGGYITFTNVFRIFFDFFMISDNAARVLSSFLEIMGGVQTIYASTLGTKAKILWIMTALSFNGVSCLMQAGVFLEKAGLPFAPYIKNKIAVTLISFSYYAAILYFL